MAKNFISKIGSALCDREKIQALLSRLVFTLLLLLTLQTRLCVQAKLLQLKHKGLNAASSNQIKLQQHDQHQPDADHRINIEKSLVHLGEIFFVHQGMLIQH